MSTTLMAEPISFGERLRSRRLDLGLTLSELAERSGLNLYAISRIESGGRPNPSWETVVALSRALGVKSQYFEDGTVGPEGDEPAGDDEPAPRPTGKRK